MLQPNTQYFIYEDGPLNGVLGGTSMWGGNAFASGGSNAPFLPVGISMNFRVAGATVPAPQPAVTLDLSSSLNPSLVGQTVTFTAVAGGSGNTPLGTLQFMDGATPLGTAPLAGGRAVFSTAGLSVGSHLITAVYGGGSGYPAAQGQLFQTVNALPATLTAAANPAAPVYGQAVALTAVVGPATAPAGFKLPTGQVTFALEDSNPFSAPTPLGTVTLASGVATLSVSSLTVGQHRIMVRYSGDSAWSGAVGEIAVTVSPAQTVAVSHDAERR
jgi:hypothetical protein